MSMTNGVSNVTLTGAVTTGDVSAIKRTDKTTFPIIQPSSLKAKEDILLEKINSVLEKPFLNTKIIDENGQKFLVIKRPSDDKDRPGSKGADELSMYSFKRALGLPKDTIRNYNNSLIVTNRNVWSDSGTIEKGASLKIPLSALGQEYYFLRGSENKILKDAVNQYSN